MNGNSSTQSILGVQQRNDPDQVVPAASGTETSGIPLGVNHGNLRAVGKLGAQGTPNSDIRLDKIAMLQQAIANGTYGIPASAVADKIIKKLLR